MAALNPISPALRRTYSSVFWSPSALLAGTSLLRHSLHTPGFLLEVLYSPAPSSRDRFIEALTSSRHIHSRRPLGKCLPQQPGGPSPSATAPPHPFWSPRASLQTPTQSTSPTSRTSGPSLSIGAPSSSAPSRRTLASTLPTARRT